ncbi:gamma-tubulin complex component 4 [Babesia ovis]|uniref:Gamma-tubulin complex component 4 n=1 Tax=Babesia ovis TaxID=5869 RepID=A0A9W5TBB0_BABOV|nr:gamma-tubulin complex component 4 [Babesia ovis]
MLHDLLMALAGHTGEIIVEKHANVQGFGISDKFEGVSPAERELINAVVNIGYKYRYVEQFLRGVRQNEHGYVVSSLMGCQEDGSVIQDANSFGDSHGSRNLDNTNVTYRGHYLGAICSGIEEYLDEYRAKLVNVEKAILADPALPLSTVALMMSEQRQVVEALVYIINSYKETIKNSSTTSCVLRVDEIMYLLQQDTGNITVKEVQRRLYTKCLELFKSQLRNWLCHGQLSDMHREFIICRRKVDPNRGDVDYPDITSICCFESLRDDLPPEAAEFEWKFGFYFVVNEHRWALYSVKLWKDVLFTGKAVRMLIRKYRTNIEFESKTCDIFDDFQLTCSSLGLLEEAVEKYRLWVAQAFWRYINQDVDIKEQIRLFRRVYMLRCHDVYTELLERSWFTMQTPCNIASSTNLRLTVINAMIHKLEETRHARRRLQQSNADDLRNTTLNRLGIANMLNRMGNENNQLNREGVGSTRSNPCLFESAEMHMCNLPEDNTVNSRESAGISGQSSANISVDENVTVDDLNALHITPSPQVDNGRIVSSMSYVNKLLDDTRRTRGSVFQFRPRSFYFNMIKRRFVFSGDASWVDGEMLLNVSRRRLEEPIASSLGTSSVWFEDLIYIVNGFETGFRLELTQVEPRYMYSEEKMKGMTLGRSCRFAIVIQSTIEPVRYRIASMVQQTAELLKDCLVIEFEIDYDNIGPKDKEISANGYLLLGGQCISAFRRVKQVDHAIDGMLCVNQGHTKFMLKDGGRGDFIFIAKLKITNKKILVELEHRNSGEHLIMETEVLDTTHLMPHNFGDAYIGIVSSPSSFWKPQSTGPFEKRNCALRISQWDYGATMSKYDLVLNSNGQGMPLCESFRRELPNLRSMIFESGLNDWVYVTMAYKCSWPVSIMLDLETMLCYNSIFQLIFLMRRCVFGLENTCHLNGLMRRYGRESKTSGIPAICRRASCAKWRMYIFTSSLLSYLQQCVIEASYKKLEQVIADSENFNEIKTAHDNYLHERDASNRSEVTLDTPRVQNLHNVLQHNKEVRNETTEGQGDTDTREDGSSSTTAQQEDVGSHRNNIETQYDYSNAVLVNNPHEQNGEDKRCGNHDTVELLSCLVVDVNNGKSFLSEGKGNTVEDKHQSDHHNLWVDNVLKESTEIPTSVLLLSIGLVLILVGMEVLFHVGGNIVGEDNQGYNQPRHVGDEKFVPNKIGHICIWIKG